jgi:tetratricopeptide (TPR) repeat protein
MPLKNYFKEQIDMLHYLLDNPNQRARGLRLPSDLTPVFMKMLAGLDRDDNYPHLIFCCEAPFDNYAQYFEALLAELNEELVRWREPLQAAGLELPSAGSAVQGLRPDWIFAVRASALADRLPDYVGCVVFVLVPDRVADAEGFGRAVEFLARPMPSPWLRFIILDEHNNPAFDRLEQRDPNFWVQSFELKPEEIEARVKADLARGTGLNPDEERQYTALLAGFAFARKEYDQALGYQRQWLDKIGPAGAPAEKANALYNLANTHLAQNDLAAAEETYGQALEVALDHRLTPLVPMILTNLGVALYRQQRSEEALQTFQVARDTCKAQELIPTEAHELDCMGRTYEADGKPDDARQCWQEALAIYNGITSETFARGREGGLAALVEQLDRLGSSREPVAAAGKPPAQAGWRRWLKGA